MNSRKMRPRARPDLRVCPCAHTTIASKLTAITAKEESVIVVNLIATRCDHPHLIVAARMLHTTRRRIAHKSDAIEEAMARGT